MTQRNFRTPLCHFNGPLVRLDAGREPSLMTRDPLFSPSAARIDLFSERIEIPPPEDREANAVDHAIPLSIAASVPRRKAEFIAGRRAAIRALRALQCNVDEIPVGLLRSPEWPNDYAGSISHVDGTAVAVAMRRLDAPGHRAIGIDIEHVVSESIVPAIHSVALNPSEQTCVTSLSDALGPQDASTIIFSCKESFFKAAFPYVRNYFDFSAIDIVDFTLPDNTLLGQLTLDLAPTLRKGATVVFHFASLGPDTYITWCGW